MITFRCVQRFSSSQGAAPNLTKIEQTHYLCAYQGDGDDGWVVPLVVNTGDWSIYKDIPAAKQRPFYITELIKNLSANLCGGFIRLRRTNNG